VIEEVGGFGEAYNIGEDLEMDAKLIKKGYKLFYVPSIFVHHHHRSSFRSFVRQMYEFGKARMRVGKQFKKFISWYHFGPLLLCIMTFSPLIVIPLLMALANSAYVSFQERNIRLFLPLLVLTMAFYVSYGGGEIVGIVRGGLR